MSTAPVPATGQTAPTQGSSPAPQDGRRPPVSSGSAGQTSGGIQGVTSKSKDQSIRLYNGRGHYNEWAFVYIQQQQAAGGGAAGTTTPGPGGQRGQPGQPPARQPGRLAAWPRSRRTQFPGGRGGAGSGPFNGGGVTPVQPPSTPRGRF